MIEAAIVGASLGSAMKYAVPALTKQGFDARDFMEQVINQLGGQGVGGTSSAQFAVAGASAGDNFSPSAGGQDMGREPQGRA